jgi:hypothetical protein
VNARLRRNALWAGAPAALVIVLAFALRAPAAPSAWLFAWFFFLGLPLGSMVILCLHALTGGRWGGPLRPVLTAATHTFPWIVLLGLPLLLALDELYPWLHAGAENTAPWFLNRGFFLARLAIYFGVWLFLTRRISTAGAHTAAATTLAHGFLVTFASVDLVMSLQPGWYSTTFGLLIGTAQILTAFAFCAVALRWLAPAGEPQDFHDLGNLLLAFVMTWAYIAFTQFLIIWYENLPHEIRWYLPRLQGVWAAVALMLVVLQFALPFLILLARRNKRRPAAPRAHGRHLLDHRAQCAPESFVARSGGAAGDRWSVARRLPVPSRTREAPPCLNPPRPIVSTGGPSPGSRW